MWDTSLKYKPRDGQAISLGSSAIRTLKRAVKDIVEVDHEDMSSDFAGTHKQVTLAEHTTDPVNLSGKAMLYTKTVNENSELFFMDKVGQKTQISYRGLVSNARCFAYLSAYQKVAPSASAVVQFDTVDYDMYSEFDVLSGWYPSVAGALYLIGVRVCAGLVAAKIKAVVEIRLVRGGTTYVIGDNGALLRAQAGDRVYVFIKNTDTQNSAWIFGEFLASLICIL